MDAGCPGENLEVLAAKDSGERNARLIGHFHRQSRRSGNGCDDGRAKPGGFLDEFDGNAAR